MRKKGESGDDRNDKYEQGGAQTITESLHDRGRDERAGQGDQLRRHKLGLQGVTFELEELEEAQTRLRRGIQNRYSP